MDTQTQQRFDMSRRYKNTSRCVIFLAHRAARVLRLDAVGRKKSADRRPLRDVATTDKRDKHFLGKRSYDIKSREIAPPSRDFAPEMPCSRDIFNTDRNYAAA